MKRLFCILFALFLLAGCVGEAPETTAPETTAPPTEPPKPWVEELGKPWDTSGALVELPLNVPMGLIYAYHMFFDGDLLLWTQDNHRLDAPLLQLCLVDLDTGKVTAQTDINIYCSMTPQALEDTLYISDNRSGRILKLDKTLNVVQDWPADILDAGVHMGKNEKAYVYKLDQEAYVLDLSDGTRSSILEEDPEISYLNSNNGYLRVCYYHPENGVECYAYIDLATGQRWDPPMGNDGEWEFRDGNWLKYEFDDSFAYTLIPAGGEAFEAEMGYCSLRLIGDDRILKISESNNRISIHDLTGAALAQAVISEQDYGYEYIDVISGNNLGGYFVLLGNYDGALRLLYWDTEKGERGVDVPFVPIPEPSEQESRIRQWVAQLESEYGLNILFGEETGGYFYDFEAEPVTDPEDILDALDTLENALENYPEGFFRQLRYGDIHRTDIHLMGTITATNSEYTDIYEAFVQESYDSHVMVMDIYLSDESTYYHEFSHVIDSFLEWDAMNREDALFSDDTWCALNPDWFPGYTYSYAWTQYVSDYSCFVDDYSTINPTEDRARVLEYAMVDYGQWTFEDADVLLEKLSYYCSCIRDAFDTSGWPEQVLWEQYLP